MKNYLFLFLILALVSCTKEQSKTGLIGEWQWLSSSGGIAGQILTPETEQVSRSIIIDNSRVQYFENSKLIKTSNYTLDENTSVLTFDEGIPQSYSIHSDILKFLDQCDDCFVHEYKRK